ncbi:MAG TPA: ABC transporter permease subunit [Flexilinea sp.]|nr:ABC transporter permease subunit [Flexilinea sp.]HOW06581.1 ABC transporter permease subunit [Flexilinea sp.]HPS48329.1 ABC transporter permease subunit [Flexilinea sp.]
MEKRTWKTNLFIIAMLAPSLLISLGVLVYPLLNTVVQSFKSPDTGKYTLENYVYLFTDEISTASIVYTFWITVVTVIVTIAISYLLALYLRFTDNKVSKFIGTIYLLPRFIPSLVAVYAMTTIIRDSGLLNRISLLFGDNFKPGLLYNAKGIILMNIWFNIPFATMIIVSALSGIQDSIIESARDVGANQIRVFFSMILPLSIKDVMIAMTFVFMGNISSFTTPYLIGPNHPLMLGVYLRRLFSIYHEYELAAATSVVIFLFSSVSAIIYLYTNLKEREWEARN